MKTLTKAQLASENDTLRKLTVRQIHEINILKELIVTAVKTYATRREQFRENYGELFHEYLLLSSANQSLAEDVGLAEMRLDRARFEGALHES